VISVRQEYRLEGSVVIVRTHWLTATKEIEAKISGDLWDRQKRWELKRDALFDAVKQLAAAQGALVALASTYGASKIVDDFPIAEIARANVAWGQASNNLSSSKMVMQLVCGKQVESAFDETALAMETLAGMISTKYEEKLRMEMLPKLIDASTRRITSAIRQELQIDSTSEIGVPA
jgi:hypothetical protein